MAPPAGADYITVMLELILLRHGESEGNRDRVFGGHGPMRLTELGHRQAEAAAAAIDDGLAPIEAIYASDLARTVETAAPLARRTVRDPVLTAALRERSVGELTGISFDEARERFPELWAQLSKRDPAWCPPGGESHHDCSRRVGAFLDEVLARHASGRVVLVSHAVAIDHLLRHVVGIAGAAAFRCLFHVDNCSIHRVLRKDDGPFRIAAINDVAHLGELRTATERAAWLPARAETPRKDDEARGDSTAAPRRR